MLCKIADLIVDIPEAGGMAPRCREYRIAGAESPDILICHEEYLLEEWAGMSYEMACYMESAVLFYNRLMRYNGILLHASAVELGGRAYLFSGPSTVGKSTHTRLWQQIFGEAAKVINDDKPALRLVDGCWYAYGTPWCGKDGINLNRKAPLAGICFLKQSKENRIRRLPADEAVGHVLSQTTYQTHNADRLSLLLSHVDNLVRQIPVWELENVADSAAARLSHETMHQVALELGL